MAQAQAIDQQALQWQARSTQVRSLRALVWRRFLKHKPAVAGLVAVIAIAVLSIFVPWIYDYDPGKTNLDVIREPPSPQHIFGTDELGRDLFIRTWDGGRISLLIGVATMVLTIFLGVLIGAAAGYYGGYVDDILMYLTQLNRTVPQLFLLLLFAQLLRSHSDPRISGGPLPIIVIIGVLSWAPAARVVRGQFLSLKKKEFIDAAYTAGARNWRIITRHLIPNAASPIIVAATLRVGAAIITESTLSFLGFGIQPPIPTWGNMLRNAQAQMTYAPWTAIFPGLAILITVLALNYIGDGLRDALDPHHVE